MEEQATGQCLCRAVRFRISGEFDHFFLCHCARCRKDSGSAHSANLFSHTATLTWVSGADHVKTFRLPGTQHVKSFCKTCGSAMPFQQADDTLLVVPAGALDTPISIRPNAHICVSERADWDNDLAALINIDGLPL